MYDENIATLTEHLLRTYRFKQEAPEIKKMNKMLMKKL